jgi:hypothetical protein
MVFLKAKLRETKGEEDGVTDDADEKKSVYRRSTEVVPGYVTIFRAIELL